jgi:hypothetical protein
VTLKNDAGEKKGATSSKDSKHTNVERVVFVTARFNSDLIPKPVIQPLPEAKKSDEKKPEAKKSDDKSPDAKAPEKKSTDDKPAAPKTDDSSGDKKPAEKTGDKPADATKGSQSSSRLSGELLALADPANDETKPENKKTDDKKTDDKKPAESTPADKKPVDKKPDAGKPTAEKPKNDIQRADEEAAIEAERKRIDTENRRNQDQYDEAVRKGKDHAKELNNRFADWYYMISEDDYKKLHVGLNDIVKKKTGAEPAGLGPMPQSPFDKGGLNLPNP